MAMKLSAALFNEIVSSLRSDGTNSRIQEKRTQGRVGLRCALEIAPGTAGNSAAKSMPICVHDISQNGLGLVSATKLSADSEFVAWFTREGESSVPVLYRVRYCRRLSSDLFSIGATFQRVLPDASGEVATIGRTAKASKRKPDPEPAKTDKAVATASA
jgi:hypothetical protein